jgi:hypothetical protein
LIKEWLNCGERDQAKSSQAATVAQLRNKTLVQATVPTTDISDVARVVHRMPNAGRAAAREGVDFRWMCILDPTTRIMGAVSGRIKLGNMKMLLTQASDRGVIYVTSCSARLRICARD